jgi:hypothetical protein
MQDEGKIMHIQVLISLLIASLTYLNLTHCLSAVGGARRHPLLLQHIIKGAEVAVICMYTGIVW